jgi:autotransporter-associated beta strand protein
LNGGFLVVKEVTIGPGGTFIDNGGSITPSSFQNIGQMILNTATNYIWQNAPISGSGSLTIMGVNTVEFLSPGETTYTGATTVSGGVLQAGAANVFSPNSAYTVNATLDLNGFDNTIGSISGTGTVTNSGIGTIATLTVGQNDTSTEFDGTLQDGNDSLALTKIGTGTLLLTGNNTYSGPTTISTGTIAAGSSTALSPNSDFTVNATLDLNGFSNTIGSLSGTGIVLNNSASGTAATLTVGQNNIGTVFAGTLQDGTGSLALTLIGTGSLLLTGDNTYSGPTTISGGTLLAGSTAALSPNSHFTVNATLDLNGFNNTIGSLSGIGTVLNNSDSGTPATLTVGQDNTNTAFNGVIQDANATLALTKIGSGTLTLTGANTYSAGTTINAGTLQLGNGGASGSITGNVTNNAVLSFNRNNLLTLNGAINGTGSVTQIGSGTTVLAGNNTYAGPTTISAGTLEAGSSTGLSPNSAFTVNATLDLNGFSNSIGSLAGTGTVVSNSATATLTVGGGNTNTTFTGVLQNGAGVLALTKIGTGTFTLTGTNTYTGGTTISAGTLQLGNGGTAGSIVGDVVDNGTLAFDRSDSVTFGGIISGTGELVKLGTGTLILPNKNTYTGTTTVNNGSLIVNGSIASTQTVVDSGGFLGGHGTIGGNLVNNGVVGQVNSPGTLTVVGNYTQSAGGTLRIGVGGAASGQSDLLAAGGHVTLGGALQLVSLGGFTLQPGEQITFITAKNGVSGSFSTVQNNVVPTGTIVQAKVASLADSVVLEGSQGSFATTPGVATTPNELAVAKMLDSAAGDPRAAALFAFLNSQPLANLPHDLELIAPTQITSINATAVSIGNVQISNLEQRLANIRGGSTGFSSAGFSINGSAASLGDGYAGPAGAEGKSGPAVFAPTPENRWGVFVTGLGEFTNVDSTQNAPGYDVNTGGFTLGIDYRVCPNFAIGLTAGYAHTSVGLDGGGNIDVNGGKIGAYATLFGNGFYLDTAVSGGPSGYNTHRTALQGTASGSTHGGDFDFVVATGYDWKSGNLTIGPNASFQYSYVGLNAFTETGSLAPMRFPDQNTESERTALGAQASYDWKIGHITVIPQVSAAWQHEFGDTAYSIVANLASGAGNSFTVSGPEIGRDSLLVGAGATVILSERVSTYLYYDGEFARTNYLSNNVSAGVRISF